MDVQWFVNPDYHATKGALAEEVKKLPWRAGDAAAWCACEFHSMREIRSYFRDERSIEKDRLYVSSYWKIGRSEDKHKIDKRDDHVSEKVDWKKRLKLELKLNFLTAGQRVTLRS